MFVPRLTGDKRTVCKVRSRQITKGIASNAWVWPRVQERIRKTDQAAMEKTDTHSALGIFL